MIAGLIWLKERSGLKFEMQGGDGDQKREKHLTKILEWFWPVIEGMAFLTWKIKIKHFLKLKKKKKIKWSKITKILLKKKFYY